MASIERSHCIQDSQLGPSGVHYIEVPLCMKNAVLCSMYSQSNSSPLPEGVCGPPRRGSGGKINKGGGDWGVFVGRTSWKECRNVPTQRHPTGYMQLAWFMNSWVVICILTQLQSNAPFTANVINYTFHMVLPNLVSRLFKSMIRLH